ncbi:MAG: sulfotransferase domain-containing protein [Candidatus Thiodiazotropha sp. (ex Dulcina madagascariensis)]|nr:sulfotransferase domain-containing protein [Candidatus Thiodiazotropha sp. (ex Dulcina madagascariensis)]
MSIKNRINFIIAGAAKCGTTSLFETLGKHPDIFIPDNKEPWHFSHKNIDLSKVVLGPQKKKIIKRTDDYFKLFDNARDEQICGEASTVYLYDYRETVKNLSDIVPHWQEIKIILVLRNPVSRAFSHYMNNVRAGYDKGSFRDAVDLCIRNKATRYRNYVEYGLYSKQVEYYLDNFKHVMIIIFEELIKDSNQIIKEVFEFLGCRVDENEIYKLDKKNSSGRSRLPLITSLIYRPNPIKSVASVVIPKRMRKWAVNVIENSALEKEAMRNDDKQYLQGYYHDDIMELEKLMGYTIEAWSNIDSQDCR